MILKVIFLPFWIVKKIAGLLLGATRLIVAVVFGAAGFTGRHIFGTIFGALGGLLLGSRHLRVTLFPRRKKKSPPPSSK